VKEQMMKRTYFRIVSLIGALVVAVGIGAGGGAAVYSQVAPERTQTVVREVAATATPIAATSTSGGPVAQVAASSLRSVVEISTDGGQGSGFVYDDEGHVVTNDHVVDGATSVRVKFSTGKSYDARVVGTDPSTDLAVIDVDAPASALHPLELADSDSLVVGNEVVAIGSPLGLEQTVTSGIVSALHRQMEAPNGFTINDSIQTDAAINHGNSGGPLLDLDGKVIGVNAQIASEGGGNDGIGFAIPSNTVAKIVSQLIGGGSVEHAYLGVAAEAADVGVAVTQVRAGAPADDAGITVGDVITSAAGSSVSTTADLQKAIDARQPGDKVEITLLRNGKTQTVSVELQERPA
jgi:putative serine protease PepD